MLKRGHDVVDRIAPANEPTASTQIDTLVPFDVARERVVRSHNAGSSRKLLLPSHEEVSTCSKSLAYGLTVKLPYLYRKRSAN